jgi:hypothetical protein
MKGAKLYKGHHPHAATASDPNSDMTFGKAPSVGQSKPYQDGQNAHRKAEKPTRSNTTAGDAAASGPAHSGWPARSPSSKR